MAPTSAPDTIHANTSRTWTWQEFKAVGAGATATAKLIALSAQTSLDNSLTFGGAFE
jgi:hypothetical protein